MKIGGKDKKLKQKTTNVHEPTKPATNGTISAMSKDELTEKMEDLIKPKPSAPIPLPPKYEDIADLQNEHSDKSSDTVVLADIHVSE